MIVTRKLTTLVTRKAYNHGKAHTRDEISTGDLYTFCTQFHVDTSKRVLTF